MSGLITLPMSTEFEKSKCSICRDTGDGFHFGAEACRACAAFFRRCVTSGKKYVCRVGGKCQISSNIRCMCRACRYSKCLQAGMNPACVQQRRDTIGKRSPISVKPDESSQEEPSTSTSTALETMPILEKMRKNYAKIETTRAVLHRREGESLFQPKIPRSITYKESAMVMKEEMSLIIDWITFCFDDFSTLPADQKTVLFSNFYMNFIMLQSAFFCHINNRDDVIYIASGDFIDMKDLQYFFVDYENPEASQKKSREDLVSLSFQSFDIYRTSIIQQVMRQKIDVYEFFALSTCLLWDFGLEGQTDTCVNVGGIVKERVLKELLYYLQKVRKIENAPIRIAMLVTILPAISRSVKRIQENVEVSKVFNMQQFPPQFYEIVNGKII